MARLVKAIAYAKVKTDAVDAHTLAQMLRVDLLPRPHMISPELRGVRDVLRVRLRLVQKRARCPNAITSRLAKYNVRALEDLPELARLEADCHQQQITLLERQAKRVVKTISPELLDTDPVQQLLWTAPSWRSSAWFSLMKPPQHGHRSAGLARRPSPPGRRRAWLAIQTTTAYGLPMKHPWTAALLLVVGCTLNPPAHDCELPAASAPAQSLPVPRLDHHQHLMSEAALSVTLDYLRFTGDPYLPQAERQRPDDADQLVQMLDEAGIPQALVFSNAYFFARHATEQPGEYEQARAEQDWTLAQVRRHPDRLYAACSVNPLRGYAAAEIERCVASGAFKALKMHFDASGVDLTNPAHIARVRQAFATANRLRLPIVAHLQSETGYGAPQARTFLREIMPAAPDVPVTINHLWGGGGYRAGAPEALVVFAEAVQRSDPGTGNLWFDLAQASMMAPRNRDRAQVVERMRQIGFARLLYGSDGPQWAGVPPKQHWEEFSACMPLTRDELDAIAGNIAPYLR